MQTTLRIDDSLYREAKAEAARLGITLTRFIEDALRTQIGRTDTEELSHKNKKKMEERNRMMEALLRRTAHFRIGPKPSRDEMNER